MANSVVKDGTNSFQEEIQRDFNLPNEATYKDNHLSGHVGERNTTCGVDSHILNNKLEDQEREGSKDEIEDEQKT